MTIRFRVNETEVDVDTPADTPLLWVLRDTLGFKGTKFGCGVGVCGICTVLVDNTPLRACMLPVEEVGGREVVTIEGLANKPGHAVVAAWIEEQVPQCGYCQPGQLIAATALLAANPDPDDAAIDEALGGILCRCGSYGRVRRAVKRAARNPRPVAPVAPPAGPAPVAGTAPSPPQRGPAEFAPSPWIRIDASERITLIIDRSEMGQGVLTGLAMLLAEELEVDLDQVHIQFAPAAPAYNNRLFDEQVTGGSTSIRAAWEPLRRAGAAARARLVHAAARRWQVPPASCRARQGAVEHPASGRRLSYGALVETALTVPPVPALPLKDPEQFRLLGRSTARLELPDMVRGRTPYGFDLTLPEMAVATVVRCPWIGGRVRRWDPGPVEMQAGVRRVLPISTGLAVVADHAWAAFQGQRELPVEWKGGRRALSSSGISRQLRRATARGGRVVEERGQAPRALRRAGKPLEMVYETPYLAHATLEPMSCVAQVREGQCHVWTGTQAQQDAQQTAAEAAALPISAVQVHTLYMGGGFGRRLETDFVREAVEIAAQMETPVQLLWSRADDFRNDRFRPAHCSRVRAAVENRTILAWQQQSAGPALVFNGFDLPYAIPNVRVQEKEVDPGVPTGSWRSVGAAQHAFVIESAVDELAAVAHRDPLDLRLDLLGQSPRHRSVLQRAAREAGWNTPLPAGYGRGLAVYHSFGSWVAQVAEVSVTDTLRVHRVVCAVDCGFAVNPAAVTQQMEGAITFGLSAALKEAVTIEQGQVQQSTFQDYPILTLAEMPDVEVHIMGSEEPPGGVGEPGVPPVAAAVANAVFAATGKRLRSLPLCPYTK